MEWEDGSKNVVDVDGLRVEEMNSTSLSVGSTIYMWWQPQGKWWRGNVVTFDDGDMDNNGSEDDPDDNNPLNKIIPSKII